MSTTTREGEIFDSSAYQLPIPNKDGHRADVIRLSVGGAIELDLYDEAALHYIQGLKLGQKIDITVTARVSSSVWTHSVKGDDQEDHAVFSVGLKAHSIDIPQAG